MPSFLGAKTGFGINMSPHAPNARSLPATQAAASYVSGLAFRRTDTGASAASPQYVSIRAWTSSTGLVSQWFGVRVLQITSTGPIYELTESVVNSASPIRALSLARLSRTVTSGTLGRAGVAAAALLGRGLARMLPVLGAGLLAYDAYRMAREAFSGQVQKGLNNYPRPSEDIVKYVNSKPTFTSITDPPTEDSITPPMYTPSGLGEVNPADDMANMTNLQGTESRQPYYGYLDAIRDMIQSAGLTPTVDFDNYYNDFMNSSVTNSTINNNPIHRLIKSAVYELDTDCQCIDADTWRDILSSLPSAGASIEIPEGGIPINMDRYLILDGAADTQQLNLVDVTPSALRLEIVSGYDL